ncbi:hypothetical protein EDD70_0375 [Hydrogenoanaerobacterium saccharovorans]|uniref:Uncharacterized protein n=2 Tax=Hydrogenoanaerobacterium saccharovorans TaxID=474960 RepID=A0A1H8B6J3_9FIRM|nr:hypothetical protein EDD70_0375 [Hydrogenoanaerobacterium saccharovorans]SEM77929.1 hypothetical protein SAMN05216180_1718 [Hydrogenoanaerobacterium saccharovorans]
MNFKKWVGFYLESVIIVLLTFYIRSTAMNPIEYIVKQINGDYAVLVSAQGIENTVAMALLPPETDEGMRLLWQNFEYTIV